MSHRQALLPAILAMALFGSGCASVQQMRKITEQQDRRIAELESQNDLYKKEYFELKKQKDVDDARAAQQIDEAQRNVERQKALAEEQIRQADQRKSEIVRSYDKRVEERASSEATLKQQVGDLQAANQALQKSLDDSKSAADALKKELDAAKTTVSERDQALAKSQSDIGAMNKKIEQAKQEDTALKTTMDERAAKLKSQLDDATSQSKQFSAQIKSMDRAFRQQAEEENALRRRVDAMTATLASDKSTSSSAKIKELQSQVADLNSYLLKAGKNTASADTKSEEFYKRALKDLRPYIDKAALSVTRSRRGIEIVIPANTVFESPVDPIVKSDTSTSKMFSSIATLANAFPEFNVMIEGHTDSDPVRQGAFFDNLDLSMQRAANVMRRLTGETSPAISSKRVRSVGCGANFPLAPNTTPEGKVKNRRIEIVLTPVY